MVLTVAPDECVAAVGKHGERIARTYLEAHGYAFIVANWYCPSGELDLVMIDGDELVFVEVKARRGEGSGRAEEAVSSSKAGKMLASAAWFVADHPEYHDRIWRCDLVAVTFRNSRSPEISHHVNAIVSG